MDLVKIQDMTRTLGKVTDNCLCLQEHHKMDGDGDGIDLWYGNVTHGQCLDIMFLWAVCSQMSRFVAPIIVEGNRVTRS